MQEGREEGESPDKMHVQSYWSYHIDSVYVHISN